MDTTIPHIHMIHLDLQNSRYGFFTLDEKNHLILHGFSALKKSGSAFFRFADQRIYLIVPQEGEDIDETMPRFYFDGSAEKNARLVELLEKTGAIECLFVETMGMYMQLEGCKVISPTE